MDREAEILGLLKVMSEQMLQMDRRLTNIERDMAEVKRDVASLKQDVTAIKGVTQLIPSLVNTVNDLHDKEIVRSSLFPARA